MRSAGSMTKQRVDNIRNLYAQGAVCKILPRHMLETCAGGPWRATRHLYICCVFVIVAPLQGEASVRYKCCKKKNVALHIISPISDNHVSSSVNELFFMFQKFGINRFFSKFTSYNVYVHCLHSLALMIGFGTRISWFSPDWQLLIAEQYFGEGNPHVDENILLSSIVVR